MNKIYLIITLLFAVVIAALILQIPPFQRKLSKNAQDVAKMNVAATYFEENELLTGKVKPLFLITDKDQFQLSYIPLNNYLENKNYEKGSIQYLQAEESYLLDSENIIKYALAH